MIYQGDTVTFILSTMAADGTTPTPSVVPSVQVIDPATGSALLNTPLSMSLISGSSSIYHVAWTIPSSVVTGDYVAVVSYSLSGTVFTGKFLEKVRIGDSRIVSVAAQDATVAKDSTVAKDATVAHQTDLATINPNNSTLIQAINAKTTNLPSDPVSTSLITPVAANVLDIWNSTFGNITINKTANPPTLTITRPDNTTLAVFTLNDESTVTTKVKQ